MNHTAKDIVSILKACKAMGVTEFRDGDFSVKFVAGDAVQARAPMGETTQAPDLQELQASESLAIEERIEADAQAELAQMQIDDPEGFEDALIQRELEQGGGDEEDDEGSDD